MKNMVIFHCYVSLFFFLGVLFATAFFGLLPFLHSKLESGIRVVFGSFMFPRDIEKLNPAQGGDITWEHSVGKWFHFLEKCCSSRLNKKRHVAYPVLQHPFFRCWCWCQRGVTQKYLRTFHLKRMASLFFNSPSAQI